MLNERHKGFHRFKGETCIVLGKSKAVLEGYLLALGCIEDCRPEGISDKILFAS